MLLFDADKEKSLSMVIETKNIKTDTLAFTFNIIVEGIKYGFPCTVTEGKVDISIPALSGVIFKLQSGEYQASLDVTGDNKYYLNPFNETIKIEQEPKVEVVLDEVDEDVQKELSINISRILEIEEPKSKVDEDIEVNVKTPDVTKKPKSKLSKMFINTHKG